MQNIPKMLKISQKEAGIAMKKYSISVILVMTINKWRLEGCRCGSAVWV